MNTKNNMNLPNSEVVFDAEHHTYTLYGKQLSGVTPIISWLFPDTYKDIPERVLNAAAEYGTAVHIKCEECDSLGIANDDVTLAYQRIISEAGLHPVYSEYLVSDEHHIASAIDKVFADDSLGDIKTTSKIHWLNVQVQLSIYAWLYEMQTGRKANKLYVIWLPKPQYGKPMVKEIERIPADICKYIVEVYVNGGDVESALTALSFHADILEETERKVGNISSEWEGVINELITIKKQLDILTEREKEIKKSILSTMESKGDDNWCNDVIQISKRAASERVSIDTKAIQKDMPEVYEKYKKTTKVASSLTYKLL